MEGSNYLTPSVQRPPPAPPRVALWVPLSRKADCNALQIRLEKIAEEVSVQGQVITTTIIMYNSDTQGFWNNHTLILWEQYLSMY